jgi:hypothetical protein
MAKKAINVTYTNAELSVNKENQYILTETTKDDTKVYNLSVLFDSLVGNEAISVTVKTVDELPSEE